MPRLYDRTKPVTEDDLIKAALNNEWTVGDVLSAYTGQVKVSRVFEELEDNGDIDAWAREHNCSSQEMYSLLMDSFDDRANIRIFGHLRGAEVRCVITLINGDRLHLYLPAVEEYESYRRLEARVRKLEKLIKL